MNSSKKNVDLENLDDVPEKQQSPSQDVPPPEAPVAEEAKDIPEDSEEDAISQQITTTGVSKSMT